MLLVVAPEKPFVPTPEEASFVVPALEEVVELKAAVVAVAMVAVLPTEEPAVVFATQHTREAVRRNAAQDSFRQRATQHATTSSTTTRMPSTAAEQLTKQAGLLLMCLSRRSSQVVGVLQPVVYAVLV